MNEATITSMNARPYTRRGSEIRPAVAAALLLAVTAFSHLLGARAEASPSFAPIIRDVQPKIVKIYGAGGFRGLEPYQSGFLISGEGHVLTAWSYVLDTDFITVTLNDGRKFEGKLLGADPRLELAVLKIDAAELPHFKLSQPAGAETGTRVLAFSNLFGVATGDEPASVLHGSVAATTRLEARRGVFETPYRGPVYVLDAMTNNPGAAGGALTDWQGRLLGMLGKELRNASNGAWLNYAIPAAELAPTVDQILTGKFVASSVDEDDRKPERALNAGLIGLTLVPDVLDRTPPYVDRVLPGSSADKAGLRPDDLVLFVNNRLVQSCQSLEADLEHIDQADKVKLTVLRGQELIEVELGVSD
jgi:serine protease Do